MRIWATARGALCAAHDGNMNGLSLAANPLLRERPPLCLVTRLTMAFSPTDMIGKLPRDIQTLCTG
jgi:hypothetical protein